MELGKLEASKSSVLDGDGDVFRHGRGRLYLHARDVMPDDVVTGNKDAGHPVVLFAALGPSKTP